MAGCGHTEQPAALSRRETEIAQQMQGLDNFKVVQFEELHESLAASLHPNHYLMVLLKRHMVGLYSTVLPELATEDLERVGLTLLNYRRRGTDKNKSLVLNMKFVLYMAPCNIS